MKHGANRLVEFLNKQDITAMAIHGNKSQGARTKALAEFKTGTLQVLVATDIAARGIDIDELPHVVNFELPNVPEDYVHRIGRTGRAGCEGEAVSLVCPDEELFLKDIERLTKRSLTRETLPGFEVPGTERAEPIQIGRQTIGVRGPSRNSAPRPAGRSGQGAPRPQGQGGQPGTQAQKPGQGRPAQPGRGPGPQGQRPASAKPAHGQGQGQGQGRPAPRPDNRPRSGGGKPAALLGGRPPRGE